MSNKIQNKIDIGDRITFRAYKKIEVGDRITFRAATRWNGAKTTRTVRKVLSNGCCAVYYGYNNFIVEPNNIISVDKDNKETRE